MSRIRFVSAVLFSASIIALAGCGGTDAPLAGGVPATAPVPAPPASATANLSWSASSGPDVAGYRLYFGTAPRTYLQVRGAGVNMGNMTRYAVTGLQPGQVYYFTVTAYDAVGNESAYSNEATKLVQ